MTYELRLSRRARRALAEDLPESVAAACFEFLDGALIDNPRRVGKVLRGDFEGMYSARRGQFRVIYRVSDNEVLVTVIDIGHRRDVYRP